MLGSGLYSAPQELLDLEESLNSTMASHSHLDCYFSFIFMGRSGLLAIGLLLLIHIYGEEWLAFCE